MVRWEKVSFLHDSLTAPAEWETSEAKTKSVSFVT